MTEQHECVWRFTDGDDWAECECGEVLHCDEIERRLNEYETLKKATEALSAERVRKMADEMETGRRISTSRHIRELRAYVEILEGKDEREEAD